MAGLTLDLDNRAPRPGMAILLDLPAAAAYERNYPGHRSDYFPHMRRSVEAFEMLQRKVAADVNWLLYEFAVPVITVDATASPRAVYDEVSRIVSEHIGTGCPDA